MTSASVLALSLAAGPASGAQSLSGVVTDATGNAPFEGAIVTIKELGRSVATNRFGAYAINNIPSGHYTVTVDYVGADIVSGAVTVPADGTTQNFVLGEDVEYTDNIIVVGTRAAQAGAINQQRAADSIISVIDSDGLGNFPDTTAADALARVVGLSVETDQGEGRYVSIRGINTDLVSASINGVRTPSPEDRRGVLLDGVPSDLLDGIEVRKSLTPDVDADSLGGVINLKTISAFDRKGQFLRLKAEGRYNEITGEVSPKGTITYSNVFNDRLGIALSGNYQNLALEVHNNEAGGWGLEGGTEYFLNDDYESRRYDLTRERIGFVGNIDLEATDTTRLYLRTLFNNYEDDEIRNKFEYRDLDDGEATSSTSSEVPINEVDAEVRKRREIRQIQSYAVGGVTETGPWYLDYEASYAFAEEDDTDNHDVTFRFKDIQDDFPLAGNIVFDTATPERPVIAGDRALALIFDPANYRLDELEEEKTINRDREYNGRINIARNSLVGGTPVTWKAGAKYRDREKTRDVNKTFSEGKIDLDDGFVGDLFIDNWRLAHRTPGFPDGDLTESLRNGGNPALEVNDDATFLESHVEDFVIGEKIFAAYAMGTLELGRATIVAGARLEDTNVDMTGFAAIDGDNSAATREFSRSYTHILPSLNLKYDFGDKWIGRAAYYTSVVRPAFGELAPGALIEPDESEEEDDNGNDVVVQQKVEIVTGNPDLDPLTADNFDLALEFYPTQLSVISIGAFYKSVSSATFGQRFERDGDESVANFLERLPIDPGFIDSGLLADIDPASVPAELMSDVEATEIVVDTFVNVSDSDISGIEFNYVQDLSELDERLDGFLFSGNLTLTESEATLPDGRKVPFLKQSGTVWNAALAYEKGPWDLRVSANYRGDYLDELVEENLDRYADNRLLVEASAKFDISKNFQICLEGKNLTDAPEYYYFGDRSRLSQYDEFGRTFIFGGRYTY
ncbi:MAG: TonB-dependent receptor [Hyphomonadaceae bacterium]|nr:TonB-dependent receptor [Hyphomonadaceae bacterium]MBC6412030.1 TonB-dependent receptor [Hyphomonadaceae bacterium]